jgi:hypothetical protein
MILGIGALLANSICPWLMQTVDTKGGVIDFRGLFIVPLVVSAVAAVASRCSSACPVPVRAQPSPRTEILSSCRKKSACSLSAAATWAPPMPGPTTASRLILRSSDSFAGG